MKIKVQGIVGGQDVNVTLFLDTDPAEKRLKKIHRVNKVRLIKNLRRNDPGLSVKEALDLINECVTEMWVEDSTLERT